MNLDFPTVFSKIIFPQPLKTLAYKKNYIYLCNAKTETRGLRQQIWRDGRVVDCGGLENR